MSTARRTSFSFVGRARALVKRASERASEQVRLEGANNLRTAAAATVAQRRWQQRDGDGGGERRRCKRATSLRSIDRTNERASQRATCCCITMAATTTAAALEARADYFLYAYNQLSADYDDEKVGRKSRAAAVAKCKFVCCEFFGDAQKASRRSLPSAQIFCSCARLVASLKFSSVVASSRNLENCQ